MTRINVVPPRELTTKHLVAEYRELPRIFNLVRAAQKRGLTPATVKAPERYTLGTGHVLFFYSRLQFAVKRQQALVEEMIARGYNPRYGVPVSLLRGIKKHWFGEYEPDEDALAINRARIADRLATSKSASASQTQ